MFTILLGLLDHRKWDRSALPKRWHQATKLSRVTSQKIEGLKINFARLDLYLKLMVWLVMDRQLPARNAPENFGVNFIMKFYRNPFIFTQLKHADEY